MVTCRSRDHGRVVQVAQLPQHRDKCIEASFVATGDFTIDKHRALARVEVHVAELKLVLGWLVGFEPVVVGPGEGSMIGASVGLRTARGSG